MAEQFLDRRVGWLNGETLFGGMKVAQMGLCFIAMTDFHRMMGGWLITFVTFTFHGRGIPGWCASNCILGHRIDFANARCLGRSGRSVTLPA